MKILQVMAGNDHGGAETAFVDMCLALHASGVDMEVATRANPVRVPMLEAAGIKVHTLPFGGPLDVFTGWRLGKIIGNFKPQIVQTWMARAAQKTPGWKSTKTPERYLNVARLGGYYKIKNFKTMDYFITITPDLKRHLVDGGIKEDKITFIHNFAEVDNGSPPVRKTDFGTPETAPVLLTLARLHHSKALDIAIKALVALPGVYIWLAGEGPDREMLEKLALDSGVADRVKFLGWRTDRDALLNVADICVFASRIEPFGTVFAQAWAQKTPVIVSDAEGPRQFCRDHEDCLMVPKNDVAALVKAVQEMLENKTLRSELVKNGHKRYLDEFTKERSVSAYLDFYLDILKREQMI